MSRTDTAEQFVRWAEFEGRVVTEKDVEACEKFAAIFLANIALVTLWTAKDDRSEFTSVADSLEETIESLTLSLQPWLEEASDDMLVDAFTCAPHDEAIGQEEFFELLFFFDIFPKMLGPERSEVVHGLYMQDRRRNAA